MKSLLLAAALFFANLFGGQHLTYVLPAAPVFAVATVPAHNQAAAAHANPVPSPTLPLQQSKIIPAHLSAGVVLGTSTQLTYVTSDELAAAIAQLQSSINYQLYSSTSTYSYGGVWNAIAATSRINNLAPSADAPLTITSPTISGGTISNASVSGITGLTTSNLSDFSYASTSAAAYPSYNVAAWGDSITAATPYTADISADLGGRTVYNEGVGGDTSTQIAARMLPDTAMHSWTTIIWAGFNDYSFPSQVESNIASMVAALGSNQHYLILAILTGSNEPSGSGGYINVTTINNYLAATYPGHYFDIREYLVQHGLSDAGITPTAQDLIDIGNDTTPTSLRLDQIHPNTASDAVIANQVANFITQNLDPLINLNQVLTPASLPYIFAGSSPSFSGFVNLNTNGSIGGYQIDKLTVLQASSTSYSTSVGDFAGQALNSSGVGNTSAGYLALSTATSSQANTAIGRQALSSDTSGGDNTAVGFSSLLFNTTGVYNVAVGANALNNNTGGSYNVALGPLALQLNATGTSDIAIGRQTENNNTYGSQNVAVGRYALQANQTGNSNTAVGDSALLSNTASSNTGVGLNALYFTTSGSNNAVVGVSALQNNTTGGANSVLGMIAGQYNTAAASTTIVGYKAAYGYDSGVAFGQNYSNTGGVYVGYQSGYQAHTSSDYNTFLGYQAGYNNTYGNDNILIGANPNVNGTHLTTGSNNIVVGFNANTPTTTASNFLNIGGILFGTLPATTSATTFVTPTTGAIGIGTTTPYSRLSVWGTDAASSTSAFAVVNSASTTVLSIFDGGNAQLSGTLTQSSDQRLKTNIQSLDASSSLSLIDGLNPVTFEWINPDEGSTPQLGFIAQQVQQVFPDLISTTSATALTPDGTLGLNYIGLISPIVSAIQALSSEVSSLITEVQGFAESFSSKTITATTQLCVSDGPSDPSPVCVTKAQLGALLSSQSGSQSSSPAPALPHNASTTPDTPPTITINGDNPAIINVGDSYADLGATVTDTGPGQAGDTNLGYKTFLNDTLVSNIVIDTSQVATDTIDYVAADIDGLTATSTRTIIIEAETTSSTQ